MSNSKMKRSKAPKEIYVRVVKSDTGTNPDLDLIKLKEQYEREGGDVRGWNVFSGGGIGGSIGFIACLLTSAVGVPITSPETFVIVGGSVLFGAIAGFILY